MSTTQEKAQQIADILGGRQHGNSYQCHCPAHDDGSPSLSVTPAADGHILLNCFAGCEFEDIAKSLAERGIPSEMLFPDKPPSKGNGHLSRQRDKAGKLGKVVATFYYRDETGSILYRVNRHEPARDGRKKEFLPERSDGKGNYVGGQGCMSGVRRVLYRLPELLAAPPDETIYFVEGEAKADLLSELYTATCIAGGSGGHLPDDIAAVLAGHPVVILPDNDETGRKFAERVAATIRGKASSIKIVALLGLPDKGDILDWRKVGHTWGEFTKLVEATQEWTAPTAPDPALSLPWLTTDQVKAMPPLTYLIPDLLPEQGLTMLYGPPEAGKTFIALDMAARLAVEGKRVLYIATEGQRGLGKRIRAWEQHNRTTIPPHYLLQLHSAPNVLDDGDLTRLLNDAAILRPALAVFDTLSDMLSTAGADENSSTDVGRVLLALNRFQQETGAAVLVVHHPTKAGTWERGSGKLRASCDLIIEATSSDGYITLACSKSKDARPFDDKHYQLIPVEGIDSCVLVPSDKIITGAGDLTASERRVLDVLGWENFIDTGAKAALLAKEAKVHDTAIYRVLRGLMRRGLVKQDAKGEPYYLSETGRQRANAPLAASSMLVAASPALTTSNISTHL